MRWITTWIACCMVACALNAYAQEWERLNFLARSSSLKSVCVTNHYVYAAGALGTVVRSDDFGTTWTTLPSENVLWRRVRFNSDSIGWLCSDGGIVARTSDAGETWANHSVGSIHVRDIWSPDGTRAVAVGEGGFICLTFDDGETWNTDLYSYDSDDDLLAVDFANDSIGCAVGGYGATRMPRILHTEDGGLSWSFIATPYIGWLASVKYVTDSVVVAAGKNGQILRSSNGGVTWDSVYAVSGSSFAIRELDFSDSLNGCAVADNGSVYTSADGGLTWTVSEDTLQNLQGVDLTPDGAGIAVGAFGVSSTANTGQSWTEEVPLPGGNVLDVDFIDDLHGWLLTQNNYVFATTDSGESWQTSRLQSVGAIPMLAAVSDSVAVVVSTASEIFRTSDSGATWTEVFSDNSVAITDLTFANEDTGFACGQLGVILATFDGGETWAQQDSLGYSLNAIHAVDGSHVWAVGNSGIVARKYGEEDWAIHTQFPQGNDFVGVYFSDTQSGVIIGAVGTTISTTDGGTSWYFADSQNIQLTDMIFANQSTGWFCGRSSYLSRTDDGGRTWDTVVPFINGGFNALALTSQYVWVVGENGAVYRSEYIPNAVEHDEATLPQFFSLSVFPNPFNSTATLHFELPREARTEIVLYDVLGREAMKLADDVFTAGAHSLTVNAENLATGVYFAELRTPEYSTTQKLLLLK